MNGLAAQEVLALIAVAIVVAVALWRRSRRLKAKSSGCGGCDNKASKAPSGDIPLKFHRRR
jgi:hypothetical protein